MLTIASLAGSESEGSSKKYFGKHPRPYTLLADLVNKNPNKELDIKFETSGPSSASHLAFYFQPDNKSKIGQQGLIKILRAKVESAFENAKVLEDGQQQVYIEQTFTKAPLQILRSLGYGFGLHKIFLVFDEKSLLSCVRIIEEYHGERILFEAKNLQSLFDTDVPLVCGTDIYTSVDPDSYVRRETGFWRL